MQASGLAQTSSYLAWIDTIQTWHYKTGWFLLSIFSHPSFKLTAALHILFPRGIAEDVCTTAVLQPHNVLHALETSFGPSRLHVGEGRRQSPRDSFSPTQKLLLGTHHNFRQTPGSPHKILKHRHCLPEELRRFSGLCYRCPRILFCWLHDALSMI